MNLLPASEVAQGLSIFVVANGVMDLDGMQVLVFGLEIIFASIAVAFGAMWGISRIKRRADSSLGCVAQVALVVVIVLCFLATVCGVAFAGCGFLATHGSR